MRAPGVRILPLLVLALGGAAAAADFVGPDSCKGCHPEAYEAWMQSKHARAENSLSEQQRKDGRCLSCHSPDQAAQATASVTCETCHGGGQYYSPEYVMKDSELSRLVGLVDPSEKQCRSCHDASSPSLRPFDFKESLKAIDHWSAERARRSAKAEAATSPHTAPPPASAKK
jgi:formate-dependent nitrite reductase cytochrome c552 subunit